MSGFLRTPDGVERGVHDGLTIGRVGCDVVVDDDKASRKHARIIVDAGVVEIEDLDSRNGTLLNGQRVTRRVLRDGDTVQIGTTSLVFVARAAQPAAGTTPAAARPSPPSPAPGAAPVASGRATPKVADAAPDELDVIEFVDEVVTVRAPARPEPRADAGATRAPDVARAGSGAGRSPHGVLQFQRRSDRGGVLGDDVSQLGGLRKLVVVVLGLALAAAVGWLAMLWASGAL